MSERDDLPMEDAIEILKEAGLPFWLPYTPAKGTPTRSVIVRIPETIEIMYEQLCREFKERLDYRSLSEFLVDASLKFLILMWKARDIKIPGLAEALPSLVLSSWQAWYDRRYQDMQHAVENISKSISLYWDEELPERLSEYLDNAVQTIMRMPDPHLRIRWLKMLRDDVKVKTAIRRLRGKGLTGRWTDLDKLIEETKREDKFFRDLYRTSEALHESDST